MTDEAIKMFVDMVAAAEKTAAIMEMSVARTFELQLRMFQAIQKAPDDTLRRMKVKGVQ